MMMAPDQTTMIVAGALIGAAAGFVMHRADFCLTAAFRDVFLFRDVHMLRALALLTAASMLLFEGARRLGWLPFHPFPFMAPPTLANAAGGLIFGVGMVLSGGCVVGSLYKLGAGRLVNAATVAGLVAGSSLFADSYSRWKPVAEALSLPVRAVTVPQALGVDPGLVVGPVLALCAALLLRWHRRGAWRRAGRTSGYLQPWAAAVALGLLGLASCLAVGMPMGVTTTYAKAGALVESLFAGNVIETHPYFRTMPLDVVNPVTGMILRGGPAPVWDAVAAIQVPLIAGIVAGSALSAVSLREFALRWRVPARQVAMALGGGILMGFSSRVAAGCNVWHLAAGLPILAMSSMLFAAGLFPGAWLGGRIVVRIL